jgi:hypothetical protein
MTDITQCRLTPETAAYLATIIKLLTQVNEQLRAIRAHTAICGHGQMEGLCMACYRSLLVEFSGGERS